MRYLCLLVCLLALVPASAQLSGVFGSASPRLGLVQFSVYKAGSDITFKTTWRNQGIDLIDPYVLCYLYQGSAQVLGPSSFTYHSGPGWHREADGKFCYSGTFASGSSSELLVKCILPSPASLVTYTFKAEFYARTGNLLTTAICDVAVAPTSALNVSGTAVVFAGMTFSFVGGIYALWRGLMWL